MLRACAPAMVLVAGGFLTTALAAETAVVARASRPLATVPAGLYSVGYNGWGDISNPRASSICRMYACASAALT